MSINVDEISWRCLVLAVVAVLGGIATSAMALEMCLAPFECPMVGEIVLIWLGERHDGMTFFYFVLINRIHLYYALCYCS